MQGVLGYGAHRAHGETQNKIKQDGDDGEKLGNSQGGERRGGL